MQLSLLHSSYNPEKTIFSRHGAPSASLSILDGVQTNFCGTRTARISHENSFVVIQKGKTLNSMSEKDFLRCAFASNQGEHEVPPHTDWTSGTDAANEGKLSVRRV